MQTPWREVENSVEMVRAEWNNFVRGSLPGTGVRLPILNSWQRSLAAAVRPDHSPGTRLWSSTALEEARAANQDLLTAAPPILDQLKAMLVDTGQVFAMCDAQARALMVEGDTDSLRGAEGIFLVPGADWSEPHSGTNAMGLAAVERSLVTVYATEHYFQGLHPWACVAAPILHPTTGEVLGILDLSGQHMKIDRHTELAVVSTVRAIESRLALLESTYTNALLEAFSERQGRMRHGALGLVDRRGQLLRISGNALEPLASNPAWQRGIQQALVTGREFETQVERPDDRRCHLNVHPVRLGGRVIGAVVEAHPVERSAGAGRTAAPGPIEGMVGSNQLWLSALDRAARAARTESTVLITGESGTGKEVLARSIHRASPRAGGPFVAVNCGALPPSLMASELFGYVGGSFTGANARGGTGKVEAANGGTLFLDEVGELSPDAQVHLLRVLQEREVVRVGGHHPIPVNVRVVAATNRNLQEMVQKGVFRLDLFYRLHVVPISLPALRQRRDDILLLVEHAYRRLGQEPPHLSLSSCERLMAYDWPGNVRELLNLVEQAVVLQEDPADLLPLPSLGQSEHRPVFSEAGEEERIRAALRENGGNAAAAARHLGWSRSTLYRKLELYSVRIGKQVQ